MTKYRRWVWFETLDFERFYVEIEVQDHVDESLQVMDLETEHGYALCVGITDEGVML